MRYVIGAAASLLLASVQAQARYEPRDVTVEIVDDRGRRFEQFPVQSGGDAYRAYLQAERGETYRIRIRNHTGERVGVVVAVDGRNIISGKRSELERREPMYVLSAHESEEFAGWRTSLDDVHEFYFTDWKNSYAEAFRDRSAKGVIAIAVYREVRHERYRKFEPHAPEASAKRSDEAGTGFGDRRYDPAVRVDFDAERSASSQVFLKYEWRETLCRKGVARCERRRDRNRFWDDDDNLAFAPFPPRR
jgi:hypothetical protein